MGQRNCPECHKPISHKWYTEYRFCRESCRLSFIKQWSKKEKKITKYYGDTKAQRKYFKKIIEESERRQKEYEKNNKL